ncbi:MAG: hypothetical protein OXU68_04775 [Bacteroidota bacterium]|nr:hypothetical protein [Bacteroidota bacterium]
MKSLIEVTREIVIDSAVAASNPQFCRLGLTDAVLLELVSPETPILTVDLNLYLEAERNEAMSAISFTYLQKVAR